jgi:tetratricopeptide (TPR) repeat protein
LAERKPPRKNRAASDGNSSDTAADIFKRRPTTVKVRRRPDGRWELVHPADAIELAEDLDEVRSMIDAGEFDVAVDELRWLVEQSHDSVEAHYLLGEIAFEALDFRLARGHFGHAFDLARSALPAEGVGGKLDYGLEANQPFMQATKGLAYCLNELGRHEMAAAVLRELASYDAADPLGAADLLAKWTAPPLVQLEMPRRLDG